MKKILVVLALLAIVLMGCSHGSSKGFKAYSPVLVNGTVGASRAVTVVEMEVDNDYTDDEVLTDCFYPIITGWSGESNIYVTEESPYSYSTTVLGKTLNITITADYDHQDEVGNPIGYRYEGIFVGGDILTGDSYFISHVWKELDGTMWFDFEQIIAAQKKNLSGIVVKQYVTGIKIGATQIIESDIGSGVYDSYTSASGITTAFYVFGGNGTTGSETFYYSTDGTVSKSDKEEFSISMHYHSSTRSGIITSYGTSGYDYYSYISEIPSDDCKIARYAKGDEDISADGGTGYFDETPLVENGLSTDLKTFTKTFAPEPVE